MPLAAIIAIAAAGAIVLTVALLFALGYLPGRGNGPMRASATEAADRTSDLAAEFFEWLRSGR